LPGILELRVRVAVWSRALADRLVGPAERWCPMCELELELHSSPGTRILPNRDDDA